MKGVLSSGLDMVFLPRARCSDVLPSWVGMLRSAPKPTSLSTTLTWPSWMAMCKGVSFVLHRVFTSHCGYGNTECSFTNEPPDFKTITIIYTVYLSQQWLCQFRVSTTYFLNKQLQRPGKCCKVSRKTESCLGMCTKHTSLIQLHYVSDSRVRQGRTPDHNDHWLQQHEGECSHHPSATWRVQDSNEETPLVPYRRCIPILNTILRKWVHPPDTWLTLHKTKNKLLMLD